MAVDEQLLENVRIVHGSPFSPVLATAHAYIDENTNTIQIREQIDDIRLFHETTHILWGGLPFALDEGATDMITAEIYNRVHPEAPYYLMDSAYLDQIDTIQALSLMIGSQLGLRELSFYYAGADTIENTLWLADHIDEALAMPITVPLIQASQEFIQEHILHGDGAVLRKAAELFLKHQVMLLREVLFDKAGNQVASTADEAAARLLTPAIISKYSPKEIVDCMTILKNVAELQGPTQQPAE
jgi:hypothetical protein